MPEPTTATAIAAIILKSTAEKLGERIGDAIGDAIFGKDTELEDMQKQLQEISRKLQEVLEFSRSTYILVEQLPHVVQEIVDRQTLYDAHTTLEASLQGYLELEEWHGSIGYETLVGLLKSWNIIIDKESMTEELVKLPEYGEFILVVTHGQLLEAVSTGISQKVEALNGAIDQLSDLEIQPLANEAENLLSKPQVKSGDLVVASPWIQWSMHGTRTKKETICHPQQCRHCNGSIDFCRTIDVPDKAWNNSRNSINSRLGAIQKSLEEHIRSLRTAVLARSVLEKYQTVLSANAPQIKASPHVSVVESLEKFPKLDDH